LALVLALGLVVAVVSGCAPQQTGGEQPAGDEPQKGGTMSFYIGEPAYIDPYNGQETEGVQVIQAVFDSLTTFDDLDPTKVLPAAAESWEPNADATVWTFKLNPNGKFSDGTPVTANDFVYSWNRICNPNTVNTATGKPDPSIISYHLGFVQGFDDVASGKAETLSGIKAVDDLTFEVTLSQPFADFEYVVAHPSLAPVPQKFVEEGVPTGSAETTIAYGEMPIGNGPFKLAEPWKHNQFIKVVANDNFATGDAPYLDGVDFKIFKDPETAYTEFEAGTLDFTQIGEGKIKDAVAKYGEAPDGYTVNPGEQVLLGPENATYYLIFNMKSKPFDNPDLRKAVSLAVNRQAICDTVFEGTRDPADNILPPKIAGYVKGAWVDSKYDPEAAKQALADAGYPEGKGLDTVTLSFNSGGGHEKITDSAERVSKYEEINTTVQADNPVAPVMFYKHHHVGSDRLNDFIFGPLYLGNFEKVWVKDAAAAQ